MGISLGSRGGRSVVAGPRGPSLQLLARLRFEGCPGLNSVAPLSSALPGKGEFLLPDFRVGVTSAGKVGSSLI